MAEAYSGWASTFPSTTTFAIRPKFLELTKAGVKIASERFWPVLATSLCQVSTSFCAWPESELANKMGIKKRTFLREGITEGVITVSWRRPKHCVAWRRSCRAEFEGRSGNENNDRRETNKE